jgi:hypothetical protein
MARRAAALLLAVALAAVVLHPAAAAGQKKPATAARREDIPYIRCQVCERIAREISSQVAKKQQALPPSKKVLSSSVSIRAVGLVSWLTGWLVCVGLWGWRADGFGDWECAQVPEIEIIDIAENVCNLKKQEADWMLRIDIVEKGDKLEVQLSAGSVDAG